MDGAESVYDVIFDISIGVIVLGAVVFFVAFVGCLGALRENILLLKIVSYCCFKVMICVKLQILNDLIILYLWFILK